MLDVNGYDTALLIGYVIKVLPRTTTIRRKQRKYLAFFTLSNPVLG